MKRFVRLACGVASLGALGIGAALAADTVPAGKLSAEQIVERNVAARGGLEAWRAIKTMTLSGKMEAGGKANPELPYVMRMKRVHKTRLEITFQDQTAVQVFDGNQGWKLRPYLNRDEAEPYTEAETKSAASWEELDGPLVDYVSKGTKIALEDKELVEGHSSYKLKLSKKDGTQSHVWIDAKTFLESKMDGEPRKIDGKVHNVSIYYRNYAKEDRVNVPHLLETVVEGANVSHKMTIDKVAVNQPMDDGLFAKPTLSMAKTATRNN